MREKMATISARISRSQLREVERLALARRLDKSSVIRTLLNAGMKEMKQQEALDKYGRGSVTLLKAAEIAGTSIFEMVALLEKRRMAYRYDISDLEEYVKRRYGDPA